MKLMQKLILKKSRMLRVSSVILIALTLLLSTSSEAFAHRKRSKIHGPFGSWTWGPDIPHVHPIPDDSSCISGYRPRKKYEYQIKNSTSSPISFNLAGQNYTISASGSRFFTSVVGGGNGCGDGSLSEPSIEFDYIYDDGQYSPKKYRLMITQYGKFNFSKQGQYLDLYHDAQAQPRLISEQ